MRTTPLVLSATLALLVACSCESNKSDRTADAKQRPDASKQYPTLGRIERLDPGLDALIPRDARIERLADGLDWSEGPIWIRNGGYLLFSDVPQNVVHKWDPHTGVVTDHLKPSGYTGSVPRRGEPGSNGLTVDSQGRLVLCQHGDRQIARVEKDGKWTVLVDKYEGKRFNSPNDLCYDKAGNLYFTDPPYGLSLIHI